MKDAIKQQLMSFLNRHATAYVVGYSYQKLDNWETEFTMLGNAAMIPKEEKLSESHHFDIASLTKLFTSVLIYKAYEEGKLNITDSIYKLDNRFIHLTNVTVLDLVSHQVELWTDGYLGDAKTKEDYYKILFHSKVKQYKPMYVDSHYIVLSVMLEKLYHTTYDQLVIDKIINVLDIRNVKINLKKEDLVVSCNYENIGTKIIDNVYPGIVHDTKARVAKQFGIATGHAGIFATCDGILKFLIGLMENKLLTRETMEFMLEHNDYTKYFQEKMINAAFEQGIHFSNKEDLNIMYAELDKHTDVQSLKLENYNNMGTRFRNPIERKNDIPKLASEKTICLSGYTGPMVVVDFINKIVIVLMSNVCHNNQMIRLERKEVSSIIIDNIYQNIKRIKEKN